LLSAAHLEDATLIGAHLEGAKLQGAYLKGVAIYRARLEGAVLKPTQDLPDDALTWAFGDKETMLPKDTLPPAAWDKSTDEQEESLRRFSPFPLPIQVKVRGRDAQAVAVLVSGEGGKEKQRYLVGLPGAQLALVDDDAISMP
jgi:hypothetical protein